MDVILTRLTLHCLRPLQYSAGLVSTTQRQGVVEICYFIFIMLFHSSDILLQMYEGACKLMAKQKVALDCLSYHAAATDKDTDALVKVEVPEAQSVKLYR